MSSKFDMINTMAETVQKNVKLTGNHVSGDKSVMESVLPEGLSMATLEQAEEFVADFGAASLIASARVMAENNLDHITTHFETTRGSIEHTVDKEIEIAGETKQGYAVTAFNIVTHGKDDVLSYATDLVAGMDFGTGDLEADA
ncbi:hypothetical protein [Vibrio phage vB_pir03]|nr:hypothetical protein [Vibrio phage vB_pir03]